MAAPTATEMATPVVGLPAVQLVTDISLSRCPIPRCGGAINTWISEFGVGRKDRRGSLIPPRRVPALSCDQCGFDIRPGFFPGFRWVASGPVPQKCKEGHKQSWVGRLVAGRLDLRCVAMRPSEGGRGVLCADTHSIGMALRGFLNGNVGAMPNFTKVRTLLSLLFAGGSASVGTIMAKSEELGDPLTRGAVQGCLARCRESGAVQRTPAPVWVPPGVQGHIWTLTPKGNTFLRWAAQVGGLVEPATAEVAGLLKEGIQDESDAG